MIKDWTPYLDTPVSKELSVLFEFKQKHNPEFSLETDTIEAGSRKFMIIQNMSDLPLYRYALIYADYRITPNDEKPHYVFISKSDDLAMLVNMAVTLAEHNQHAPHEVYHAT